MYEYMTLSRQSDFNCGFFEVEKLFNEMETYILKYKIKAHIERQSAVQFKSGHLETIANLNANQNINDRL